MTTALDTALAFAERGWYVFPIQPHKKVPYKKFSWTKQSTNDPSTIRKAAAHPKYKDCNWAVDCGRSNLFVVDVDKGGDPTPYDSDLVVKTPGGGFHFYYQGEGVNSVSKLSDNVDTRGRGGYVLIPGSANGEKNPYEFIKHGDPSPPPFEIVAATGRPKTKSADRDVPLVEYDLPHNIERAKHYLKTAPESIEGQGGDNTLYRVACTLRDFGLSESTVYELLIDYNEQKASPPWEPNDLATKARNAFRHAQNQPGVAALETLFPDTPTLLKGMRVGSEINPLKIPPRKPILGSRYYADFVTETVAEGGGSKSTLTMTEAIAIASGINLTNADVFEPGRALIINLEDPLDELERRVAAIAQYYKIPKSKLDNLVLWSGYGKNFHLVGGDKHGNLTINASLVDKLTDYARENDLQLISIDPLVKCHALDENNNMAMDKVMITLSKIAEATHCAVGVVHHVRKPSRSDTDQHGDAHAGRGASSVAAAARVVHTLGVMSETAAKAYGIMPEQRRWYVRLDHAKGNFSPPATREDWFQRISVKLPQGDDVGVLQPVKLTRNVTLDEHSAKVAQALFKINFDEQTKLTLSNVANQLHLAGVPGPNGGSSRQSILRGVERTFALYDNHTITHPDKKYKLALIGTDVHRCSAV